jgi:translation initiation factor 2 subunit 2
MDYDEQLDRAMAETPDIAEGGSRFEVPDPDVRPEGNVTVYENFQATVDRLSRDEEHVLKFIQTDLGTSASIDEKGRARLTGDFRARRVADAVESYVDSFVRCQECGLPDTRLVVEQGTQVLKCDACGALSPVPDL